MDFQTPVRRPMERRKSPFFGTQLGSGGLSLGPTEADGSRSALTDAPVRNTQKRSTTQQVRISALSTDCKPTEDGSVQNDSPSVEFMMQQLLIEKENSPLTAAGESAERQLNLTTSPLKAGQKRERESTSGVLEEDDDTANIVVEAPRRVKQQPFRDTHSQLD